MRIWYKIDGLQTNSVYFHFDRIVFRCFTFMCDNPKIAFYSEPFNRFLWILYHKFSIRKICLTLALNVNNYENAIFWMEMVGVVFQSRIWTMIAKLIAVFDVFVIQLSRIAIKFKKFSFFPHKCGSKKFCLHFHKCWHSKWGAVVFSDTKTIVNYLNYRSRSSSIVWKPLKITTTINFKNNLFTWIGGAIFCRFYFQIVVNPFSMHFSSHTI